MSLNDSGAAFCLEASLRILRSVVDQGNLLPIKVKKQHMEFLTESPKTKSNLLDQQ